MNENFVMNLAEASAETCGSKAAALGALLRAEFPVPDGFVVPFTAHRAARAESADRTLHALHHPVGSALSRMGDPAVAVRSSAGGEDSADASAAGQYESTLAVQGADDVVGAIGDCWNSASSARVADYLEKTGAGIPVAEAEMAVIVQRLIDADVSGVMFTPAAPGGTTRIEASWGLGLSVVGGTVTPDSYEVDSGGSVRHTLGTKSTRLDRDVNLTGVSVGDVDERQRGARTLDDAAAACLAALGHRVTTLLGGAQDIEWAIADHTTWLLQARPITAALPPARRTTSCAEATALTGTPGSHGVASGRARIIRGPGDFSRIQAGDILICAYTDPSWTPLFTIAAGVVTETGGALSHAAIVAREYGIPAVLGIRDATELITDGAHVTLNGTTGTLSIH